MGRGLDGQSSMGVYNNINGISGNSSSYFLFPPPPPFPPLLGPPHTSSHGLHDMQHTICCPLSSGVQGYATALPSLEQSRRGFGPCAAHGLSA